MIILISGKQGSGKTTVCEALTGHLGARVANVKFAGPIYEMHDAIYNVGEKYGIFLEGEKDGALLQLIGSDWARKTKGEDIWVKAAKNRIAELSSVYSSFIIDDLRFENEFGGFPKGIKIRLECSGDIRKARAECWRENDTHASETGLDEYAAQGKFDLVIDTAKHTAEEAVQMILERLKL